MTMTSLYFVRGSDKYATKSFTVVGPLKTCFLVPQKEQVWSDSLTLIHVGHTCSAMHRLGTCSKDSGLSLTGVSWVHSKSKNMNKNGFFEVSFFAGCT